MEALISSRDEARRAKDWTTADRIRKELEEMGIEVIDTREGTIWRKV
jgi:cysteinyl-tRNA synthetase